MVRGRCPSLLSSWCPGGVPVVCSGGVLAVSRCPEHNFRKICDCGAFPVYFHLRVSAVSRCPGGDGVLTSVSQVSRVSRPLVSQWGGFVGAVSLGGVLVGPVVGETDGGVVGGVVGGALVWWGGGRVFRWCWSVIRPVIPSLSWSVFFRVAHGVSYCNGRCFGSCFGRMIWSVSCQDFIAHAFTRPAPQSASNPQGAC